MTTRIQTTGWLSFFLFLLVLATTAMLLGLFTPSWQVVFLEDGRTEHHHGLWLDCKRDFSYDYGRPREYYETLHRRFDLAGPFDQFWLPSLNCVFKFDYWLDDEDWFEHSYDENKLWGDAYQHLFIGWKIAALAAHVVSALCALFAVFSLICAFCHRLCTCIAAVLVVIAVLSGLGGNVLYYMFASDQDNYVIKEEDGIYQQHFGWSFWVSLVGNLLMLFCSMIGCVTTKIVLGKGRRTKFVKIHLNDMDDDSAHLLQQHSGVTGSTGTSISSQQQQPFRRSRSTVYKIDSQELRQWERETMRNIGRQQKQQLNHFKRTNSMPSMKKGSQRAISSSDISHAITEPAPQFLARPPPSNGGPKGASGGIRMPGRMGGMPEDPSSSMDVIYEYVDQPSFSVTGTTMLGRTTTLENASRGDRENRWAQHQPSRAHHYDPVPLAAAGTPTLSAQQQRQQRQQQQQRKGQLIQPLSTTVGDTEYLQPKSLSSGGDNSSVASSSPGRRTPLIVPVDMKGFSSSLERTQQHGITSFQQQQPRRPIGTGTSAGTSTFGVAGDGPCAPQVPLATFPAGRRPPPALAKRSQQEEMEMHAQRTTTTTMTTLDAGQQHFERHRGPIRSRSSQRLYHPPAVSTTILSEVPPVDGDEPIRINTFQQQQQYSRSIADLVPLAAGLSSTAAPVPSLAARAMFDRRLTETSSTAGTTTDNNNGSDNNSDRPTFLGGISAPGSSIKERLEAILSASTTPKRAPSEMDRSVGSSGAATHFGQQTAGSSPAGSDVLPLNPSMAPTEDSEGNVTVIHRSDLLERAWTDV